MNRELFVIAHDMRSAHNVGALFRLCDGLGAAKLWLTGYTPYPPQENDTRLPHIQSKLKKQIHKTALGAEQSLPWEYRQNPTTVISGLRSDGVRVIGLEQDDSATAINNFKPSDKLCLLLGREVDGLEAPLREKCDSIIEIPMLGAKESHNVVTAAAIALSHCRFYK